MVEQHPDGERTLREQRELTIDRLCQQFAQDRLTLEELERRIDVAERSHDQQELAQLLADLQPHMPAVAAAAPVPAARGAPLPDRSANSAVVAIMGGAERRGPWRPAEHTFVLCLMGGAELDFRDVYLPPGETEVFIVACMGGCDIIVPPDLPTEVNGLAIMGGFGHRSPPSAARPDLPLLRVHGFALMGGVDVSVRLPGESSKDARRRERAERRDRRTR